MTKLYLTDRETAALWAAATTGLRQMQVEGYSAEEMKTASAAIYQLELAWSIPETEERKP